MFFCISVLYLSQIKTLCEQENIRLIITLLPSKLDVNSSFRKEVQELHYLDDETMNINQELTTQLITFLQAEQFEYIDLKPALQNTSEKVYWDQDLHINKNAHRIIGELLNTKIKLFDSQ